MSTKRKLPQKLAQPKATQSAKILSKGNLDDSKTIVSGGTNGIKSRVNGTQEVLEISSDSSSEGGEDSEEESADEQDEDEAQPISGEDVSMADADAEEDDAQENGEPSFGDLVRANASEPIDVAGAFEDPSSRTLAYPQGSQIQPPSGASLGTVLTQALKTNDVSLLESCLHTTDVPTIRATIQRLDSPLAGTLLQKLAERLHRRPGRAGSLMVWVQWTLVTHGGYLSTQKDLIKKLAELNKVIDERAKGLQPLLALKGKLDMLEAQVELRRNMQHQRRSDDDEEDEGVIYVEGQESDEEGVAKPQRLARNGDLEDFSEGSEVSEDMPMTNGVIADSEDEEDSSGNELIDDEASETDNDSGNEDEVDHDDEDSEEESDEEPPPTKMQRVSGIVSKKR
ncbi:U3 small nucleolar RNA-associated protein [Lachnellula suecica]|uniref:U3 small nucleolar RNA-associated protein n=1 Tax=Lachnellula suecica TaxID=602035 RepID=A0A8T9C5T9_9HELO|nr:U3 small nucleolar RNA-associated protein [Lachnellula suecica]